MSLDADRVAGSMRKYHRCVTWAVAIISVLLAFLSVPSGLLGQWKQFLFFPAAICAVWLPVIGLRKQWPWAFAVSVGLAALAWLPLLIQTIARIRFVLRHGGMDCAECEGSPMAFLFGMVLEQWAFLPLTAVVWAGLSHIRRQRHTTLPS